jgi:lon-related putative ATP-dependent protease
MLPAPDPEAFVDRFKVNLAVDHAESSGAPVLYESNPSLDNLVGKLEHRIEYGTPVTDFNLIRPGALHLANGGYLLLDAERLIQKPFAWEALKRAMSDQSVRIESVSQLMNLTYSVSLEPQAIPLRLKIVLLGSRRLYHVLRQYDADFDDLFKVVADFDDHVEWSDDNVRAYSELIASIVQETRIRHLDASAVARVLEHGSRLVEDRERLSAHIRDIRDLLREADFIAGKADAELIQREHVAQAVEKRIYRLDRFRELVRENVARGLIHVETKGMKVGQINGLSVMSIGHAQFGQPIRITATARLGRGELIDIESESHLGGNIHSKAVMIVSSFLGSRYAKERPLSLHASLVFEQSYAGVEGDSASIAEVCALISSIIDHPIKQSLAVTGSMDQHGTVQAIGGVNEKIEGFFDICQEQGLNGEHGVLIPVTNRDHLMLRQDVVAAVTAGQFHVFTIATVDDAIALLFAPEGQTKIDSSEIDHSMRSRVEELYEIRRRLAQEEKTKNDE